MNMHATEPDTPYRKMVHQVRIMRSEMALADELQRRGKTLSEIADYLNVPVRAVHQSLYWERVQS